MTPSFNWDKFWSGTDIWLSTQSHFVKSTHGFGSGSRFRHQVIYTRTRNPETYSIGLNVFHTFHALDHWPPTFLWQRAMPVIAGRVAGRTWKNNCNWYTGPPILFCNFCSVHTIYKCDHGPRVRDPYIRTLQPRGPTKCTCQFAEIIISHITYYKFRPSLLHIINSLIYVSTTNIYWSKRLHVSTC